MIVTDDKDSVNNDLIEAQSAPLWGWLYSLPARLFSLFGALGLVLLLTIVPNAVATSLSDVDHGLLTTMMLGVAAGLVHGVGFVPRSIFFKILFGPGIAWVLMGYGVYLTWISG